MMKLTRAQLTELKHTQEVDQCFLTSLESPLAALLLQFRAGTSLGDDKILALSEALNDFLVAQFGVHEAYDQLQQKLHYYDVCEYFYQEISKPAIRKLRTAPENIIANSVHDYAKTLNDEVVCINGLLKKFSKAALSEWCQYVWITQSEPFIHWQIFNIPKKMVFEHLVTVKSPVLRTDYTFTGATLDAGKIERQVNYCIDCHFKDNDSCSKGLIDRRTQTYKINPLGKALTGCPLGQKISQMHVLRKKKSIIASLAMTMIDNPLCILTGDRICNDCMAACIYQKFDPVDTPSVESNTLSMVLSLPYGAEIYLLLARWNPLQQKDYMLTHKFGGNAAVIGMGPAGAAMSYYLLRKGAQVFAFDGLPIRAEKGDISSPIKDFYPWAKAFMEGVPLGLGGVMDYGVTARWDKRLLALLWVLLYRFPRFSMQGNTRFGGALTLTRLQELGFSQVVLATGAGLPQAHPVQKHPGMMFANEFLMHLQTTGVMHQTLQWGMSLPIRVVGGGLTAIDAATEALVYYIRWVEQVAFWFDQVNNDLLCHGMDEYRAEKVLVWLEHGRKVREYRRLGQPEKIKEFIDACGGVSVLYRRSMQESPAYRTNHIELTKALEQGVHYIEHCHVERAITDKSGYVSNLLCRIEDKESALPAATVLFATGSKPNVSYFYEHRSDLQTEGGYYKRSGHATAESEVFPNYVTILGDLHPEYQGSVVGALASAKDTQSMVASLVSGHELCVQKIHDTIGIRAMGIKQSGDIMIINISSERNLPIGSYLKLVVYTPDQTQSIVNAVVVTPTEAWVLVDHAQALLTGRVMGIQGPIGTRLVAKKCSDNVLVVADKMGMIWACAIAYALTAQGKRVVLYADTEIDQKLGDRFSVIKVTEALLEDVNSSQDIYFCVQGAMLQYYQTLNLAAKSVSAVVDGPMMCGLKGICGQCIQWQVADDGTALKAVYACSWQNQPIELIDVGHLISKQVIQADRAALYRNWTKHKHQQGEQYYDGIDTVV
ncbi:FAD-dependent oxidoreductase [Candidatus Synchoanobacter obligatus]|uniref:FAD-dependent oxidoreductase n=1 Tax=Candidatus Synchoanobacter obligatus TaxID=2919597 RepID=A0ABT1L5S3_9GAMM|nr:FAD-dependent oxidoreductase [Candidatus Synchoanobacter obligatus]MCP8352080.1 FAD-dependent oxidoreductase [Candidatus Synchoanobacter obligatus]